MDGQSEYYSLRVAELKDNWGYAAQEVCNASAGLEATVKASSEQQLSTGESFQLNEQKREETNVSMDVAVGSVSMGATAAVVEALTELFGGSKQNSDDDEETTEVISTRGTSQANQREAQRSKMPPQIVVKKAPAQKPKESVFADLMKNPDADRLRQENIARQKALLAAQQREMQEALKKQANNTQARNNVLGAAQAYQRKLENLGMVPSGMFSGPKPSSYKETN